MRSDALETLFGGAAGGGKSHGQLLDALRFAVCYPGSQQLMLRRTMPELERSLVPAALRLYPQCIATYKVSEHRWEFANGSTLEFGYCDAESDVTKYQSAEYDVIRFDELTHFTESQFTYLSVAHPRHEWVPEAGQGDDQSRWRRTPVGQGAVHRRDAARHRA